LTFLRGPILKHVPTFIKTPQPPRKESGFEVDAGQPANFSISDFFDYNSFSFNGTQDRQSRARPPEKLVRTWCLLGCTAKAGFAGGGSPQLVGGGSATIDGAWGFGVRLCGSRQHWRKSRPAFLSSWPPGGFSESLTISQGDPWRDCWEKCRLIFPAWESLPRRSARASGPQSLASRLRVCQG